MEATLNSIDNKKIIDRRHDENEFSENEFTEGPLLRKCDLYEVHSKSSDDLNLGRILPTAHKLRRKSIYSSHRYNAHDLTKHSTLDRLEKILNTSPNVKIISNNLVKLKSKTRLRLRRLEHPQNSYKPSNVSSINKSTTSSSYREKNKRIKASARITASHQLARGSYGLVAWQAGLVLFLWLGAVRPGGAVILPPPWANTTLNPCAERSWQQLFWPPHDRCYQIFSQGPCEAGEEVFFDAGAAAPACRCSRGSVRHGPGCHPLRSRGPCQPREFLREDGSGQAECRPFKDCPPGHAFWPSDERCYEEFTRGPCQHGDLFHIDPGTGWPSCGCHATLMRAHYWPHSRSCHVLRTRGPCVQGHVFYWDEEKERTDCGCGEHLKDNYHQESRQCYPLGSRGPCPPGNTFSLAPSSPGPSCRCLPGHIKDSSSGACQRAYTRARCPSGQFFKPLELSSDTGQCAPLPCKRPSRLYSPERDRCYPVGSSGPCPAGQLWVYERASVLRGRCHCGPASVGYWAPHKACYPQGVRGPCPPHHVVTYSTSKGLACSCDSRRGYRRWNGRCQRLTPRDIIREMIRNSQLMKGPGRTSGHRGARHMNSVLRPLTFNDLMTAANFEERGSTNSLLSSSPNRATTKFTPDDSRGSLSSSHIEAPKKTLPQIQILNKREPASSMKSTTLPPKDNETMDASSSLDRNAFNETDIRERIARLTHRGLIAGQSRDEAVVLEK